MQKTQPQRSYHARTFVALGDAYWKTDQLARARAVWREGLQQFPQHEALKQRTAAHGQKLAALIQADLDPDKRVNTDLSELWADTPQ